MKRLFCFITGLFIVLLSCLLFSRSVEAAKLYVETDRLLYQTGQSGQATLNLNTEEKAINAISGIIRFDPSLVKVTGTYLDKSIVDMWVQEALIDYNRGEISFRALILNPGYNKSTGRLLGIWFVPIAPGRPDFGIVGFEVLANDGQATNIATKGYARIIKITGQAIDQSLVKISSSTHPDQGKKYEASDVVLSWAATEEDIIAFAYGFNKNPNDVVPTQSSTTATSFTEHGVAAGTWYAHVRAKHKTRGWLETEHFKINISSDTSPTQSSVRIGSSTHPYQNQWYNEQDVSISWAATEEDIIAFAYGFNKNPNDVVPTQSSTTVTSFTEHGVAAGTWYAHVRAKHKTRGWLATEHFKVNIDPDLFN